MAIQASSLQFLVTPPSLAPLKRTLLSSSIQFKQLIFRSQSLCKLKTLTDRRRCHQLSTKAIEESGGESKSATESDTELSELGEEIKKALDQRKEEKGEVDFWSGVSEEIKEIEWPVFGKVLGITGVVLGVIAGSSVVLLTVNAVLAELSDKVFAGKGVQDFF